MAQVLVRNLDEATVASLKAQAASKGHSLEQELREVLSAAATPSRQEVRQLAAALRRRTRKPVSVDLEELIREDRDR